MERYNNPTRRSWRRAPLGVAPRRRSTVRRGVAAVEFALVLPVIVLLLLGSLEMGRAVMVRHVLEETARAGCRVAVFENGTHEDVMDIIDVSMKGAGISDYIVNIDPDPPENLEAFEPVTVTVTVPYKSVSWLPASNFMAGAELTGLCVMPAEGDGANDPESDQTPSGKKNKKNKKNKKEAKKNKKNKKNKK